MKIILKSICYFMILFSSNLFADITTLVDFGASPAQNVFGLDGWTNVLLSSNMSYTTNGPGGVTISSDVDEFTDNMGVEGTSRLFSKGERIVVTWYNNSDETFRFSSRISFTDNNTPDEDGSQGSWFTMRNFYDYRQTYAEVAPYSEAKTMFVIESEGVHKSNDLFSIVNLNIHCEWFESYYKPHLVCDRIELLDDADHIPENPPTNLGVNILSHQSAQVTWNIPESNGSSAITEYFIYVDGQIEGYSLTNSDTLYYLTPGKTCTFTVTARDDCGNESPQSESKTVSMPAFVNPDRLVTPQAFFYSGSFRLPETFDWGAEEMTFNSQDNSLFVTNINNRMNGFVGQVKIPGTLGTNVNDYFNLPEANIIQQPTDIRPESVNNWEYVDIWRSGLECLPDEGRIYSTWSYHYQLGTDKTASLSCCDMQDLSGSVKSGAWYIGSSSDRPLDTNLNDYLFDLPQTWANANTGGRTLVTGRYRDGGLSGLGPTLYCFAPFGDLLLPPPFGERDAVALLQYGDVTEANGYFFPHSIQNYNHADELGAADWISCGSFNAVAIIGVKGLGENWYGYNTEQLRHDWIIADLPYPEVNQNNLDNNGKGWKSTTRIPMILLYDPDDLAAVAQKTKEAFEPQPYAAFRFPVEHFCASRRWDILLRSATFDENNQVLYISEFIDPAYIDGYIAVHVYKLDPAIVSVELSLFYVEETSQGLLLHWNTTSESNNFGFEIERKTNSDTVWQKIGFVKGAGSSSNPISYSFLDSQPIADKLFYRLKQIDRDGYFIFSDCIEFFPQTPEEYSLAQNYPNPFNPSTTIKFTLAKKNHVVLNIYNTTGEIVATLVDQALTPNTYSVFWDAQNQASGVYLYQLTAGHYSSTKKCVVLK